MIAPRQHPSGSGPDLGAARPPEGPVVAPWLVAKVLSDYALDLRGIHGPAHWLRVRGNGLALAAMTPGADAVVVELFALMHDCRRQDEERDLGHGERAAVHARRLAAEGALGLDPARLDLLTEACARHERGQVSADPTIGCCWDADRPELSRLWRRPRASLLSTRAALDAEVQRAAWAGGTEGAIDPAAAAGWGLDARAAQVDWGSEKIPSSTGKL